MKHDDPTLLNIQQWLDQARVSSLDNFVQVGFDNLLHAKAFQAELMKIDFGNHNTPDESKKIELLSMELDLNKNPDSYTITLTRVEYDALQQGNPSQQSKESLEKEFKNYLKELDVELREAHKVNLLQQKYWELFHEQLTDEKFITLTNGYDFFSEEEADTHYNTEGGGQCFFHAVFGREVNGKYSVENPQKIREKWFDFLRNYSSLKDTKMPTLVQKCIQSVLLIFFEHPWQAPEAFKTNDIMTLQKDTKKRIEEAKDRSNKLLELLKDKIFSETGGVEAILKKLMSDLRINDLSTLKGNSNDLTKKLQDDLKEYASLLDPIEYESNKFDRNFNSGMIIHDFLDDSDIYQAYLNSIKNACYYIFFEEFPMLASLNNIEINVWYKEQQGYYSFYNYKPDAEFITLLNLNNGNVAKVEIYHAGFTSEGIAGIHYSRAKGDYLRAISAQHQNNMAVQNEPPSSEESVSSDGKETRLGADINEESDNVKEKYNREKKRKESEEDRDDIQKNKKCKQELIQPGLLLVDDVKELPKIFDAPLPLLTEKSTYKTLFEQSDEESSDDGMSDVIDLDIPNLSEGLKRRGKSYQVFFEKEEHYEGTVVEERREGFGIQNIKNGQEVYIGQWLKNKREGVGHLFEDYGRSQSHGSFKEGLFFEGDVNLTGTILSTGYKYIGKVLKRQFHGLGTLQIKLKGKTFELIGKWENGKIKEIFRNEIKDCYESNYTNFFNFLETMLFAYQNFNKQSQWFQDCIELVKEPSMDTSLLNRVREHPILPTELKKYADELLQLHTAYNDLKIYLSAVSLKSYVEKFIDICLMGVDVYENRLKSEINRNYADEYFLTFKELIQYSFPSQNVRQEGELQNKRDKLLKKKTILSIDALGITLIMELAVILKEYYSKIPFNDRSKKDEPHKLFIKSLWTLYFDNPQENKVILTKETIHFYQAIYFQLLETLLSLPKIDIFFDKKNGLFIKKKSKFELNIFLTVMNSLKFSCSEINHPKKYLESIGISLCFNEDIEIKKTMHGICMCILKGQKLFLETKPDSSEIFTSMIDSYTSMIKSYENKTNIVHKQELINVTSVINYFLYIKLRLEQQENSKELQNSAIELQLKSLHEFFKSTENSENDKVTIIIANYINYNKRIDNLGNHIQYIDEGIKKVLTPGINNISVLIHNIFSIILGDKNAGYNLKKEAVTYLIDLMDIISNLDLRWFLNSDPGDKLQKMVNYYTIKICNENPILYELFAIKNNPTNYLIPHYTIDIVSTLLELLALDKLIDPKDELNQLNARIKLLNAIAASMNYFSGQVQYNSLDAFKEDRINYFQNTVQRRYNYKEFCETLDKIVTSAIFNTKSIPIDKALDLFENENKSLGKEEFTILTYCYNQYDKQFKTYNEAIMRQGCGLYLMSNMPDRKDLVNYRNAYIFIKNDPPQLFYASNNDSSEALKLKIGATAFKQIDIKSIKDELKPLKEQVSDEILNKFWGIITSSNDSLLLSIADIVNETNNKATNSKINIKDCTPESRRKHIPHIIAGIAIILSLTASGYLEKDKKGEYVLKSECKKFPCPVPFIMPYTIQILGVLRLLAIDSNENVIKNHLAQILTGQGKSWTLALLAGFFALLGYRVTVACYSEELTSRDGKDFERNLAAFNFDDRVRYRTFDALSEETLAIKTNAGVMDIFARCTNIILGKELSKYQLQEKSKEILLIDEVDVFFTDKFGAERSYVTTIPDNAIAELQKYIWQELHRNENITIDALKRSCQKVLSDVASTEGNENTMLSIFERNSIMPLLDPHINKMIDIAKEIYLCQKNNEKHKYMFELTDTDCIRIKNLSGKFDDLLLPGEGYYNAFYYLLKKYERDHSFKSIELKQEQYGYLVLNIGSISFAELPKAFEAIFGATGTLKNLLENERTILGNYKISSESYCPSFFGASNLNKQNRELEQQGCIIATNEERWFREIVIRTKKKIDNPDTEAVSVLIFFENEDSLEKFKNNYRGDLGQIPYFITENKRYENESLDLLVDKNYAGKVGQVTLLTKTFGRGIDFKPSAVVNKHGGIHVIQTFFSMDMKEEIQIKGRTARQDYPGSYEQIFCLQDLQKKGLIKDLHLSEAQSFTCNDRVYTHLLEQRCIISNHSVEMLLQKVTAHQEVHNNSITFFKNIFTDCYSENRIKYISTFFERHQENIKRSFTFSCPSNSHRTIAKKSRTICLMDATGSMSNLLEKAKNTVVDMFERACKVLAENNIEPSSAFEIQFAVYRNYCSGEKDILEYSGWETNPEQLREFMKKITSKGGQGNEAVEVGFWHVNEEITRNYVSQVILIGDMPPNTQVEIKKRRSKSFSPESPYMQVGYYQDELQKINNRVPIHAFFVGNEAEQVFKEIARLSQGQCQSLDINSSKGAEMLTNLVTTEILRNAGESLAQGEGEKLVQAYNQAYRKNFNS